MSVAIYYLQLLPRIREVARECGYAVGLHGSMTRDLDLIAAPWGDDVKTPAELATAVRDAVHGHWKPGEDNDYHQAGCPGRKPHGRLVWSIHLGGGAYLDLSVTPSVSLGPAACCCLLGEGGRSLCGRGLDDEPKRWVTSIPAYATCAHCLAIHPAGLPAVPA